MRVICLLKSLRFNTALLLFIGVVSSTYAQVFELRSDNLVQLYSGKIEWADLDKDGDLELIYNGFPAGANEFFTKVYENDNGSFVSRNTSLPDIRNGSFALGDYDRDDDLDILLSGLSSTGNISVLYQNNGAFSFSLKYSFPGLINSVPSWFDIDNDNDLDFLIAGVDDNTGGPDPFVEKMFVYENTGTGFTPLLGTNLQPRAQCSVDWADSNGDGKTDAIITGFDKNSNATTTLYVNNGDKTFSENQGSNLKAFFNGDAKWGDFDNDGDMDLLISGVQTGGTIATVVYENDQGILQERTDIQIQSVGENWFNGTKWVDYDNDGLLDILVSGRGTSVVVLEYIFKLYKNKGDGQFEEVSEINFSGIAESSVDFGDFDNDGDVDLCFMGASATGPSTGIYENTMSNSSMVANTKPNPPSPVSFSQRFFRKQITLAWADGSDAQTPVAGLSYNFYLKDATSFIAAPVSNLTSGYLLANNHPANGHSRRASLYEIPEGKNYNWAVQSVDAGKAGSVFSSTKTFYHIYGPEAVNAEILDVENIKLSWLDNSSFEDSYRISRSTNPIAGFTLLTTMPSNTTSDVDNYSFLTDTFYYYRIYALKGTNESGYDSLKVLIPTAPDNLLAHSINASKIDLSWQDLSDYETGYEVQRKLSSAATFESIAILADNSQAFTDTGLSEGTSYDYRVRAINAFGTSAFGNVSTTVTNFRPLGTNFAKETPEDVTLVIAALEFANHFSDPDDADELVAIEISSLPQLGILRLGASPVHVGQIIPTADLGNLQFVPESDANGVSEFSFFNNDGKDNSIAAFVVTLTIVPVNDAPVLSTIADVEIDVPPVPPISFVVTDVDNTISSISVTASSDNQTLIKDSNITIQDGTGEKSIHVVPEQNASGVSTITVSANDGAATAVQTFKVTITLITGVTETRVDRVNVYPNPVVSTMVVSFPEPHESPYTLVIHDLLGKEITKQTTTSSESTFDFHAVMSGVYVLRITNKNGESVLQKRIIKKH